MKSTITVKVERTTMAKRIQMRFSDFPRNAKNFCYFYFTSVTISITIFFACDSFLLSPYRLPFSGFMNITLCDSHRNNARDLYFPFAIFFNSCVSFFSLSSSIPFLSLLRYYFLLWMLSRLRSKNREKMCLLSDFFYHPCQRQHHTQNSR